MSTLPCLAAALPTIGAAVRTSSDQLAGWSEDIAERAKYLISGPGPGVFPFATPPQPSSAAFLRSMLGRGLIERFGRQMLVPGVGLSGQRALHAGSVLIVGVGGLGSPIAFYLAAAGVGRLGLVDYDTVEQHNLHRQIVHRESTVGLAKVDSAKQGILSLNSGCQVDAHNRLFDKEAALELTSQYDVVVDASDNPVTRYVVNDACILYDKPLVSGAALRWEGHVTTFNYRNAGPCYRCVYPEAPPPGAVTNCDAGGIMGPVTGIIGSMQAMEALLLLMGKAPAHSGTMCLYDAGRFRTATLRPKRKACLCSGTKEDIRAHIEASSYEAFCGDVRPNDKTRTLSILSDEERVSVDELHAHRDDYLLVDVRPREHFDICSVPGSVNVPLADLLRADGHSSIDTTRRILVICRRGNDSQLGARLLQKRLSMAVKDVRGGLVEYARRIDPNMPIY